MKLGSSKASRIALRRWWVLILTMTLGALAAFAVSSSRQTVFTARAVLVVPPFDNSAQGTEEAVNDPLGNPLEADLLAFTYTSLLAEDTVILDSVASAAGLSMQEVSNRIEIRTSGTRSADT